jgi:hypothetical protein
MRLVYWGPDGANKTDRAILMEEQKDMTEEERTNANRQRSYERRRQRRLENKGYSAVTKQKYDLTKEQYIQLLEDQNYMCAIEGCGFVHRYEEYYSHTPEERNLSKGGTVHPKHYLLFVDHCHATNKVRGLVCSQCNIALGWMEDAMKRAEISSFTDYLLNSAIA